MTTSKSLSNPLSKIAGVGGRGGVSDIPKSLSTTVLEEKTAKLLGDDDEDDQDANNNIHEEGDGDDDEEQEDGLTAEDNDADATAADEDHLDNVGDANNQNG